MSLIKRGLIRNPMVKRKGEHQLTWYVTDQAIEMLQVIDSKN